MSDLRDRLARLLCVTTIAVDGWPTGVSFAWSDLQPRSQARWRTIADALLASEAWQAREAVVEAATAQHLRGTNRQHGLQPCAECAALARLAETRGEEKTNDR